VGEQQVAWSRASPWHGVVAAVVVVLVLIGAAAGCSTDERVATGAAGRPTTTSSTTSTTVPPTSPRPTEPGPTAAPSTQPTTSSTPATDREPARAAAAELLRSVRVADELDDAGYDRDLFPPWVDDDGDGCDTRCEVLEVERIDELPGLPAGGWRSVYDDVTTDDPSELDIDHLVALGEAWRSGAATWDPARRAAFATDLDDARTLIAVTASSNRSKGDNDPSQWRPPVEAHWCTYVTDWLAVKLRWDLAVDPIEFTALQFLVDDCG
jgi:hypothetical protein